MVFGIKCPSNTGTCLIPVGIVSCWNKEFDAKKTGWLGWMFVDLHKTNLKGDKSKADPKNARILLMEEILHHLLAMKPDEK